ncbi:MAG TPA: hypothetical protein VNL71_19895 [Chloroflexota bacterium]|nr:hypothetical protein [Chloroflexota bacterium]
MMGNWNQRPPGGTTLTLTRARRHVQRFIDQFGNPHSQLKDTSTGHGAFETLVNKVTGATYFEYGPARTWNTTYRPMYSQYGMMGAWQAGSPMTVSAAHAKQLAQRWLTQHQPGTMAQTPDQNDQFPGYYSLHILKGGKITGMLSVNGYSGQAWYHAWHGAFTRMKTL